MSEETDIESLRLEVERLNERLKFQARVQSEQATALKAEIHNVLNLTWSAIERIKALEVERDKAEAVLNVDVEPAKFDQPLGGRPLWG